MSHPTTISPIRWENNQLFLLDQRYLPQKHDYYTCSSLEQAAAGIENLVVRGAPAIGITAAYAVYLGYLQYLQDDSYDFPEALNLLMHARPTAVNLAWAVNTQQQILTDGQPEVAQRLLQNAIAIHHKDVDDNIRMGDFGASLIAPESRVLTHCNAGALATAGYGTALGVIRSAWSEKKLEKVFASETRPWLQGLRLTAWELSEDNIPVSVITEGAVSSVFKSQQIDWVIVGADRVCANGDVVNKVGTCNLAILAQHYGIKVMVAAPTSSVDMETHCGEDVSIEIRSEREILATHYADNELVTAWNPVFDVTPAALVSAIVTEKGVVLQPDKHKMKSHMS